jgi:hypothetical protein
VALLTGQNVCDEVALRISNRVAANSSGAGSIINCANRVLGMIASAGSYSWEQTSDSASTTSDSYSPANCDAGKEMAFFNANGTQIVRAKTSDTLTAAANFTGLPTANLYNTFRLSADTTGLTYQPKVFFFPQYGPTSISFTAIYHLIAPTLVYGASPTVQWIYPDMDMLLIDWTEAYVKKIYGMAGWGETWADCVKRVGEYRVTYASQRENTGPQVEEQIMVQEKTTGRD